MADQPFVTLVVPVWRDVETLAAFLSRVSASEDLEIIVAGALGSQSAYRELQSAWPRIQWTWGPRGRAVQMNAGAAIARGRWVLFLHADSSLPPDWMEAIRAAADHPDVVGGAFTLALDSVDWRARWIEAGVRLRVRALGLPYGDQGIFVRRSIFAALGGYRDLPLMEDIDLIRRLKRHGRLHHARQAIVSSARRWERDGWISRSAENLVLASLFLVGASPQTLARRYFRRKRSAIVMMARAPWTAGKTRLGSTLDETAHAELRDALFLDTFDAVRAVPNAEHIVACEPATACEQLREWLGSDVDVVAQRGTDLGERMNAAFSDVFRLGYSEVLVVGSDLPDLPPRIMARAITVLARSKNRLVLGPAVDGGYYLIGLTDPQPALFRGIAWGTARVLAQTLEVAQRGGLQVVLLERWPDVDDDRDLEQLAHRSSATSARRTLDWSRRAR